MDTARLRARLSEYYSISQNNVHAYVLGEHGDSAFIPWSFANISNVPIDECHNSFISNNMMPKLSYEEVEEYVKKSGARVIERKGATFYAVAVSVCHICKCILNGAGTALSISTMMHGEYGVDDVCLSVLHIVDRNGVRGKITNKLTHSEIVKLHTSANKLKEIISQLEI